MEKGERTIEHLTAVSKGGLDNLDNMVLAHKRCNLLYGVLSKEQKLFLKMCCLHKIKIKQKCLLHRIIERFCKCK